jgi:hypothetical protein
MKNLIRNILKEFVDSKWVNIQVVGNLSEKQSKLLRENVYSADIKFSPEVKKQVDLEYKYLKDKLKIINPFTGSFTDKFTGVEKTIEFNIIPGYHYVERMFRKEDPKYSNDERVVNPSPYEGVNLLLYNKDRLAQEIFTKRIRHNDLVRIETKDGSNYQMLVTFNDSSKSKKDMSYNLVLINQIKGKGLHFYTSDKEVRLNSPR